MIRIEMYREGVFYYLRKPKITFSGSNRNNMMHIKPYVGLYSSLQSRFTFLKTKEKTIRAVMHWAKRGLIAHNNWA